MHIENFTKPLYQVFPKDQLFFPKKINFEIIFNITAFEYGLIGLSILDSINQHNGWSCSSNQEMQPST
jgi:hypothetical protein